ncbi:hypothetical protein [Haladaptatus halobius]|nr:hypothetical protein [Haladaptatus halobius]
MTSVAFLAEHPPAEACSQGLLTAAAFFLDKLDEFLFLLAIGDENLFLVA